MDLNRMAAPRDRRGASVPDIMNDPAFTTNSAGKRRSVDEPDTCRICRGEGSEEEQLFYPCKCSGSIKFVHQECLMQWLSHSQKKYCELCKTPFRFTKLYDPHMPQELPVPVFLKEMLLHGCRSFVTWLRFVLVAFVWLGWLPWSMRAIWRGLFWLADGRWPNSASYPVPQSTMGNQTLDQLAAHGTSPSHSHILASNHFNASITTPNVTPALPTFVMPFSTMLNFTAGEPMLYNIVKRVLFTSWASTSEPEKWALAANSTNITSSSMRRYRQPSWLSDVAFLNRLTPYSTLNNILIDTFEGQIITLSVVIAFILIFLIREWVVQQQPAINIAEVDRQAAAQLIADGRANQQPEPAQPAENNPIVEQPHPPPREAPDRPFDQPEFLEYEAALAHSNGAEPNEIPVPSGQPPLLRSNAHPQFFPRLVEQPQNETASGPGHELAGAIEQPSAINQGDTEVAEGPDTSANALWPGLDVFKDLWARGERNPTEIRRIIEQDGRQEELGWIIAAMQRLERAGEAAQRAEMNQQANEEGASGSSNSIGNRIHPENPPVEGGGLELPDEPGPSFALRSGNSQAGSGLSAESFSPSLPGMESFGASAAFGLDAAGPSRTVTFDLPSSNITRKTLDVGSAENSEINSLGREQPDIAAATAPGPDTPRTEAFPPFEPAQPEQAPPIQDIDPPQNPIDRASNWFWGGVPPAPPRRNEEGGDDEHIVQDLAQEAPFVPVRNRNGELRVEPLANAAPAPAADAVAQRPPGDDDADDAVDEADDLEGIMELVGMQGPIVGLLQNAVFSALLVSFTVALGIWLPYLWGKIALVMLTNPIRLFVGIPIALFSIFVDVIVDTLIGSFGYVVYWANVLVRWVLLLLGRFFPVLTKFSGSNAVTVASLSLINDSTRRLTTFVNAIFTFHESDLPLFSVLSHQALRIHQARIAALFNFVIAVGKTICYDIPLLLLQKGGPEKLASYLLSAKPTELFHTTTNTLHGFGKSAGFFLEKRNWASLKVGAVEEKITLTLNSDLAQWDTKDRIIAILVGYCFASVLGMFYLRVSAYWSRTGQEQRAEGPLAEVLQQAGGVMKVILIIGIEMIVFPLYCGILLDIALLPLFESATLMSRATFTFDSPFTSLFVHWFIGTCYMFHFALFVSMCRKIMRSGVLYFIRDPDDPTFHPVRDVLERNITTQLRKIAFSALVYGALVIICLGGVVWGLSISFRNVLPIHWSSNEPVLEFPVDLLFYNFVVPLAVRALKPSDGLHTMYNWWFHTCAHYLRLTHFLFGTRVPDEEGRHTYRTWRDAILRRRTNPDDEDRDKYFQRDGRFVRTPASDQVRIPKGNQVFLEVNEDNERIDGKCDSEDGLHGKSNEMFTPVYVPPRFKSRIATFILMIWVFAAVTGLGCTIIPLLVGRRMISSLFPSDLRVNDIYAFSAGVCVVGGLAYALLHCREGIPALAQRIRPYLASPTQLFPEAYRLVVHVLRLLYMFWAFALFLPTLFALITELYILIPLHTYIASDEAHVIHFVQDWTLGVLYVRMVIRLIYWHEGSRPAIALNAVLRNGWFDPDIKLATRAFILPATLVSSLAVFGPVPLGFLLNSSIFRDSSALIHSQVYRYSFPGALMGVLLVWAAYQLRNQIVLWRGSIRDDVYLIGERLHNFGEKRAKDVGVTRRMITS
ncbi:hypothetical protein FQN50_009029 [Emmonsiellopsis sp. PD_5]|nr:hypothetical protein FQN50_009029 [Emmonsiellopsis sp. PD_5]